MGRGTAARASGGKPYDRRASLIQAASFRETARGTTSVTRLYQRKAQPRHAAGPLLVSEVVARISSRVRTGAP